MKNISDKSIDMILCDLPYGTSACKWDSIIPFDKLWNQYNRIIKDDGAQKVWDIESQTLRTLNNTYIIIRAENGNIYIVSDNKVCLYCINENSYYLNPITDLKFTLTANAVSDDYFEEVYYFYDDNLYFNGNLLVEDVVEKDAFIYADIPIPTECKTVRNEITFIPLESDVSRFTLPATEEESILIDRKVLITYLLSLAEEAGEMLSLLSGRDHQVMTGCTVLRGEKSVTFTEVTDLHFRPLTEREIARFPRHLHCFLKGWAMQEHFSKEGQAFSSRDMKRIAMKAKS